MPEIWSVYHFVSESSSRKELLFVIRLYTVSKRGHLDPLY